VLGGAGEILWWILFAKSVRLRVLLAESIHQVLDIRLDARILLAKSIRKWLLSAKSIQGHF